MKDVICASLIRGHHNNCDRLVVQSTQALPFHGTSGVVESIVILVTLPKTLHRREKHGGLFDFFLFIYVFSKRESSRFAEFAVASTCFFRRRALCTDSYVHCI